MAIFPITNYYVVNYDVLRSSSFKAGMVLMRDANGYAIKADRSLSSTDTLSEQLGKYIGFASGDHDTLNNIILSDPVGSNYLDSNNVFRDNVNSQYGVFKRSISEFSDDVCKSSTDNLKRRALPKDVNVIQKLFQWSRYILYKGKAKKTKI